jgi:hypothetical protein
MAEKKYECKNKNCDLGTLEQPGRFSGNQGVCPNCGKEAK